MRRWRKDIRKGDVTSLPAIKQRTVQRWLWCRCEFNFNTRSQSCMESVRVSGRWVSRRAEGGGGVSKGKQKVEAAGEAGD